jgi:hypothetical protein
MPLDELDQFLSSVPGPQQPEDELDKYLRAQEQSKRPSPPVEVSVDGKVVAPKSPQIDVLKAEVPDRMTKLRMKTVEDEVAGKGPRVLPGMGKLPKDTAIGAGIGSVHPIIKYMESTAPDEAVNQLGKSLLSGATGYSASIYNIIGQGINTVGDLYKKATGRSHLTLENLVTGDAPKEQNIFNELSQSAGAISDKAGKEGLPGVVGEIVSALPRVAADVATMGSMGKAGMAIYGGLQGAANADPGEGLEQGFIGAVQGALSLGTIKALNVLPKATSIPAAMGIGYLTTAGTRQEKIKGGITFGVMQGAMGPSEGLKLRDLWAKESKKFKVGSHGERLPEPPVSVPDVSGGAPRQETAVPPSTPTGELNAGLNLGTPFNKIFTPEFREKLSQLVRPFSSIDNIMASLRDVGWGVSPGKNPSLLARSYLSANADARYMIDKETFVRNPDGSTTITGKGLKTILKEFDAGVSGAEPDVNARNKDFSDYLKAKRTVADLQRAKPGQDVSVLGPDMPPEMIVTPAQVAEANRTMANLGVKYGQGLSQLETSANELYAFQERMLRRLVGNRFSEADIQRILAENPHYIPFDRIVPEFEEYGMAGRTGQKLPVSKIRGSEREIEDVFGSVIKHTVGITGWAARNEAVKSLADLSDVLPDRVGKPVQASDLKGPKAGEITYWDNGVRMSIKVDPNLYASIDGLTPSSIKPFNRFMRTLAQGLRFGATTTPDFVARNFFRDQFTKFIQGPQGGVPFYDSVKAIAESFGGGAQFDEYLRSGSASSGFAKMDRNKLAKTYNDLVKNPSVANKLNIVTDLADISDVVERATRFAAYKQARANGMSEIEAGAASAESTVDFRLKGLGAREQIPSVAFLNAGIQSIDKTVRSFRDDPVGVSARSFVAITIPTVVEYLINKDNPDWWDRNRVDKDLFWAFPVGNTFVRIPRPWVYGQIFGSIPQRFIEYLHFKDPAAIGQATQSLVESITPYSGNIVGGLLPTGIKPIIEMFADKDFFRQRPIVPESRKRLPASEQYSPYTGETAKLVGGKIGASPSKIEHLIRGYSGGLGKYALEAADLAVSGLQKAGIVQQTENLSKTKPPLEPSTIPFIKAFVERPIYDLTSDSLQKFYKASSPIIEWKAALGVAMKSGDGVRAKDILQKHPEVALADIASGLRREMSEKRNQIETIATLKGMSDKDKKVVMEKLAREIIESAKVANKVIADQLAAIEKGKKKKPSVLEQFR